MTVFQSASAPARRSSLAASETNFGGSAAPGRPAPGGRVAPAHAPSVSASAATIPHKARCLSVFDIIGTARISLRALRAFLAPLRLGKFSLTAKAQRPRKGRKDYADRKR